jgi:hypothetical protein
MKRATSKLKEKMAKLVIQLGYEYKPGSDSFYFHTKNIDQSYWNNGDQGTRKHVRRMFND